MTPKTHFCPRYPTAVRQWLPDGPRHVLIPPALTVTKWVVTSASSGRTSQGARVIVDRDTPNQQASTSWVAPWLRTAAG